jgi:hypothetical protein
MVGRVRRHRCEQHMTETRKMLIDTDPGGKSIETGAADFIHGAAVDCGGELTHDPSTVAYLNAGSP